jgi:hypothetical protein
VQEYRHRALARAQQYPWEAVTDQYEAILEGVLVARGPGRLPEHLLHSDRAIAVG